MLKFTFILALILAAVPAMAQHKGPLKAENEVHDFGTLRAGQEAVADFILTNTGKEEVVMLSSNFEDDCSVRYSEINVAPGAEVIVRIKFTPERRGAFSRTVAVNYGNSPLPLLLTVKGKYESIDLYADRGCPDFSTPTADKGAGAEFTVTVLDAATDESVRGARVAYRPRPMLTQPMIAGHDGSARRFLPVGLYSFDVSAGGYKATQVQSFYVGGGVNSMLVYLSRNEMAAAERQKPISEQPGRTTIVADVDTTIGYVENPGELSAKLYGANNIVFLIDVSGSMNAPARLPLLKTNMKTLLAGMRGIDRISLVTYSSYTKIILPPLAAERSNKEIIAQKIDSLQAYGSTAAGRAIRDAYKLAEENYIEGGNNQIFLATDGSFNLDKNEQSLNKLITEYRKKGIYLTVFGFGTSPTAIKKMKGLAETGGGSFVEFKKDSENSQAVMDEVKARSRKK